MVWVTMYHASSQPYPSSSSRMRISSGMARVGWVSLIWMTCLRWKLRRVPYSARCLRTMDWMVAETKKYCCLRRRDLPS
ncbi:Uncharacterised protein [Flavonifractor plautii]|uniref:Uncharacterized protein n=1 Tax=Flavonifractor plautii TaxID=292800 RepID=A0A174SCV2_FLAPL|nr:Uncharacterised protein [Flavonifractor plautii]